MKKLNSISKFKSILTLAAVISSQSFGAAENTKGLLPEVKLSSSNEEQNQETAFKSEVLITRSENKAIESLNHIIKKKKGSPDEADLNYRLAELYMRRAKSGRFFDLNERFEKKLSGLGVQNQKATTALKNAISIYNKIEAEFPSYKDMDSTLFNNALAHLQTKQTEKAKSLYTKLITKHQKSKLIPDALLELGEIYYNQQNFKAALESFKKLEDYPNSRAYPYGVYKSAWSLYNLKETDAGIQKLLIVLKNNPANSTDQKKYNLRKEALRDLTLFVGETVAPQELFSFFSRVSSEDELGEVIINLANLYESHSRYKEISIFVKEFIDKYPQNANAAKSYSKLIQTNETLKERETVISYMKKMSDFCQTDINQECRTEFRKVSLEISKKWWDIWLKNKKHSEFSKLTEQAFEILLSQEDPLKPDSMSRFAYAELLFQMEKYELSEKNYEEVSLDKKMDKTKSHDALYGALYSLEKQMVKDKLSDDPALVEKQKALATRYVTEFSNGEHIESLQFKLAFIAYKQQDYDLSLKSLMPFTASAKNNTLRTKAEDIILDIYNIKKDYINIQKFAEISLAKTSDASRKSSLKKMVEEADYTQTQSDSASLDTQKRIALLKDFSEKHKNSKLSQDSLWQSISLAYSNGFEVQGADISQDYAKKFPDDKRNVDATKEALKAYIDAGQLTKAVATSRSLAKVEPAKAMEHLELSCDLLRVNSQLPEARGCYKALYDKVEKSKKAGLRAKLMKSFGDNKNMAELESIENQLAAENVEPYATQIIINRAKKLLTEKKYTEAFNLSMKANSRSVDADIRAEARLIQAQVLEKEFVTQSVKARESKFATVLALKTEKLDKAFTAYSSTIKMSKTERIQSLGLQGINRLYSHFIEALTTMPLPASLAAAEQTALRDELAKMTSPFVEKRKQNLEKLRAISKLSSAESEEINWAEMSVEKTIEPRIHFPSAAVLTSYLPNELNTAGGNVTRLPANEKKCDPKKLTAASIGSCIQSKKFNDAEKLAYLLTETKEQRPLGLYYLSVIANEKSETDKSLWMIEKALASDSENSLYNYQKGKVLYSVEGVDTALPFFEKVLDMRKSSNEIRVMNALKSFSDRDFLTAADEFSRMSTADLYNYNVAEVYIESVAQKGETEQAVALGQKLVNFPKATVDTYLEHARVLENFAANKEQAVTVYQKAITRSPSTEQREWIKKKIEYLKMNKIGAL
jgi:TolA-binding protein